MRAAAITRPERGADAGRRTGFRGKAARRAGEEPAAARRPATPGRSSVILDEEDEEESLGALGKALKEVGDDDLLALARARAQVVRDWLAGEGGVPGERVFVLEPKVEALGEGGEVQFSLR